MREQENKIHHLNFLDNGLPDKCANLIIADPPYFQIKGAFDFIWEDLNAYLKDVYKWAAECKRLLADNGTLFWYGHAKNIAYQQVILDDQFNLLNSLVWEKTQCQTLRSEIAALRRFAPVTERILMYGNGRDISGLEMIREDPELFLPVKRYFDDWLGLSGLSMAAAVKGIGSSCTHWFGYTTRNKKQFSFPSFEKWERMDELFPHFKGYDDLRKIYDDLRVKYEIKRQQCEHLRRPFNLTAMTTDVLKYSQESHITKKYNHDTKKPEGLTTKLITTCSRKGDLVVVPFAGSGTECAMASKEGRRFVGYEIDAKHVKTSTDRCHPHLSQPGLFT
jgi:site-specific DNA-methyltransferase (adenine-specific)